MEEELVVKSIVHDIPTVCFLKNVLLVPILWYKLLYVGIMARACLKVSSKNNLCSIIQNKEHIAQGSLWNMHYYLNRSISKSTVTLRYLCFQDWNVGKTGFDMCTQKEYEICVVIMRLLAYKLVPIRFLKILSRVPIAKVIAQLFRKGPKLAQSVLFRWFILKFV